MSDKARVQYKATDDPISWEDVSPTKPLPVTGSNTEITDMPPISFEGGGGAETVVSDVNPLPVDVIEVDEVDDDAIAKAQELPLKLNLPYVFSKTDDYWVRQQGSTDGYPLTRTIGLFDTGGHQLDIETDGSIHEHNLDNAVDGVTTALKIVDYAHHEVHSGSSFTTSYIADIANGANLDLLIVTPDSLAYAHLFYELDVQAEAQLMIYEAVTATAGDAVVAYNRRRVGTPDAATVVVTSTPTGITTGSTIIRSRHMGSGKAIGGGDRGTHEFILKPATKYLFRVTNSTASDNYMSVILDWYEHTDVA